MNGFQRLALAWRILWLRPDSNLVEHAKRELPKLADPDGNDPEVQHARRIMELVWVFASQKRQGPYAVKADRKDLHRVLALQPLTALNGVESEWVDFGRNGFGEWMQQNVRCPDVFRSRKQFQHWQPWLLHPVTGARVPITFPYFVPGAV